MEKETKTKVKKIFHSDKGVYSENDEINPMKEEHQYRVAMVSGETAQALIEAEDNLELLKSQAQNSSFVAKQNIAEFIGQNIDIFKNIESINITTNKRTGERIGRFTDNTGQTTIQKISENNAISERTVINTSWRTKEERDNIIRELDKKNYLQDEIADIVGVSQGTVSNVKKKFKEKE